jgi:hypothetical protein
VATWQESGGEPDTGRKLPVWLGNNGFRLESVVPRIFCIRPADYMWRWPAEFIQVYVLRLQELGKIDSTFAAQVLSDLGTAEKQPTSLMLTPLVLEIVAQRI